MQSPNAPKSAQSASLDNIRSILANPPVAGVSSFEESDRYFGACVALMDYIARENASQGRPTPPTLPPVESEESRKEREREEFAQLARKIVEAQHRTGAIEVELGTHLVRCLELVGELASQSKGGFAVQIARARNDTAARTGHLEQAHSSNVQDRMGSGSVPEVGEVSLTAQQFSKAQLRQLAMAFSTDPSTLKAAVSRMWITGGPVDITSIIGRGVTAAPLFSN